MVPLGGWGNAKKTFLLVAAASIILIPNKIMNGTHMFNMLTNQMQHIFIRLVMDKLDMQEYPEMLIRKA